MGQDFSYLINVHNCRKSWVFCKNQFAKLHLERERDQIENKNVKNNKKLLFSMGMSWSALMGSFKEQFTTKLDWLPTDLRERKGDLGRERKVGVNCEGLVDRLRY